MVHSSTVLLGEEPAGTLGVLTANCQRRRGGRTLSDGDPDNDVPYWTENPDSDVDLADGRSELHALPEDHDPGLEELELVGVFIDHRSDRETPVVHINLHGMSWRGRFIHFRHLIDPEKYGPQDLDAVQAVLDCRIVRGDGILELSYEGNPDEAQAFHCRNRRDGPVTLMRTIRVQQVVKTCRRRSRRPKRSFVKRSSWRIECITPAPDMS